MEKKNLIITFLVSLSLILGFVLWQGKGKEEENKAGSQMTDLSEFKIKAGLENWGDIPINGGIVEKNFEFVNKTGKSLNLKRIATSCMCTTASVYVGEKTTKYFGMEMHTDKNPPVDLKIENEKTGKVSVKFDPAAHGPQGTGPFERIIYLYFSDPKGTKEIVFKGVVTPN